MKASLLFVLKSNATKFVIFTVIYMYIYALFKNVYVSCEFVPPVRFIASIPHLTALIWDATFES